MKAMRFDDGGRIGLLSSLGDGACRFVTRWDAGLGEAVCVCVWQTGGEWWSRPSDFEGLGLTPEGIAARGLKTAEEVHEFLVGLHVERITAKAAATDAVEPLMDRTTPLDGGPASWRFEAASEDRGADEKAV